VRESFHDVKIKTRRSGVCVGDIESNFSAPRKSDSDEAETEKGERTGFGHTGGVAQRDI